MSAPAINPVAELGRYLMRLAGLCRGTRDYEQLVGVMGAQDIHEDVVEHSRQVVATTHQAETYDNEALAAIDAAQHEDSEGGANITPGEAAKIRRCVARSADLDHRASELANPIAP